MARDVVTEVFAVEELHHQVGLALVLVDVGDLHVFGVSRVEPRGGAAQHPAVGATVLACEQGDGAGVVVGVEHGGAVEERHGDRVAATAGEQAKVGAAEEVLDREAVEELGGLLEHRRQEVRQGVDPLPEALEAELAGIRAAGFALRSAELRDRTNSIAAPYFQRGRLTATLGLTFFAGAAPDPAPLARALTRAAAEAGGEAGGEAGE